MRRAGLERLPLTARFGVIEYDGWDEETLAESIQLARAFRRGARPAQRQRRFPRSPTAAFPGARPSWPRWPGAPAGGVIVGIDAPATADRVLADGLMDLVMVGRAHLANPHWPYHAALQLSGREPRVLPAPYAHWLEKYRPNV